MLRVFLIVIRLVKCPLPNCSEAMSLSGLSGHAFVNHEAARIRVPPAGCVELRVFPHLRKGGSVTLWRPYVLETDVEGEFNMVTLIKERMNYYMWIR